MCTFNVSGFYEALVAIDFMAEALCVKQEYLEGYAEEEEAQEAFFTFLYYVEEMATIVE